jgi:hypothetical protein
MARKQKNSTSVADLQPDELNELKLVVADFMKRYANIENEMETLKEDRKTLVEEFKEKLDMKTLQQAIKAVKLEAGVAHKDTFDMFVEVLKDDVTNGLVDG